MLGSRASFFFAMLLFLLSHPFFARDSTPALGGKPCGGRSELLALLFVARMLVIRAPCEGREIQPYNGNYSTQKSGSEIQSMQALSLLGLGCHKRNGVCTKYCFHSPLLNSYKHSGKTVGMDRPLVGLCTVPWLDCAPFRARNPIGALFGERKIITLPRILKIWARKDPFHNVNNVLFFFVVCMHFYNVIFAS
jgi:hypothetical protein